MDPNACLTRLFDALHVGDRVTALNATADLREWLLKGGHAPGPLPTFDQLRDGLLRKWWVHESYPLDNEPEDVPRVPSYFLHTLDGSENPTYYDDPREAQAVADYLNSQYTFPSADPSDRPDPAESLPATAAGDIIPGPFVLERLLSSFADEAESRDIGDLLHQLYANNTTQE